MNAAVLSRVEAVPMTSTLEGCHVDADMFRELIVSHRRMERVVYPEHRLRGLRDLDSGELFLIDERRLFDVRR